MRTHLKELEESGHNIKKISVVGYSLGGLVARYVIGILDHEGLFDTIEPVNFTTFATPHLGTRTPLSLWTSHIYNSVGPSLLSASGQQMFLLDNFGDSGKPLVELMADPNSIFIRALKKFPKRTLYANIINDRLAPFYTTAISPIDPYANSDLDTLDHNYVEGYEPVVINGKDPINESSSTSTALIPTRPSSSPQYRYLQTIQHSASRIATVFAASIIGPFVLTGFLANSAVESLRSQRRIYLHSSTSRNNFPALLQRIASNISDKADMVARMPPVLDDEADRTREATLTNPEVMTSATDPEKQNENLALQPNQFEMIRWLDQGVGFEKFYVWFHKTRFSHAAIVRRRKHSWFDEGMIVSRHWVENQFIM